MLADFDYEVRYNPGKKHNLADALSRLENNGADTTKLDVTYLFLSRVQRHPPGLHYGSGGPRPWGNRRLRGSP